MTVGTIPKEIDFFLAWLARNFLDSGIAVEIKDGEEPARLLVGKLISGFFDTLTFVDGQLLSSEEVGHIFDCYYNAYRTSLKGQNKSKADA